MAARFLAPLGAIFAAFLAVLLLLWPGAAMACDEPDAARRVTALYGERIAFDVLRNGRPVGEAVTEFRRAGALLEVHSRMTLDIRVLFVPFYRFSYDSRAQWCGDRLAALAARVDDNGTAFALDARASDGALLVDSDAGRLRAPAALLPTDHWNTAVLDDDAVLNTLTGRINAVRIVPCAEPSPLVMATAPTARCHAYTGELEAEVYHDADGRWVGLAFAGRDGSDIVYRCRDCAAAAPTRAARDDADAADNDG
ncbi:MAG: DUF6134 family protein [Gammaproteobacteria bacterium]